MMYDIFDQMGAVWGAQFGLEVVNYFAEGEEARSAWRDLFCPLTETGASAPNERQVHREMMAIGGNIAKDTLFGPERPRARAIDWDQSDRGHSSRRAVTVLHLRRRIHGRNRPDASITETPLPRGRHPYMIRARTRPI